MTGRGSLENNTDDADRSSPPDENGPPSKPIGGRRGEKSTEETPGLQDAHDVGAEVCSFEGGGVLVCELV